MLTQDRLKQVLDYDHATGLFTWRVSRGRCHKGTIAGDVVRRDHLFYRRISVDGRRYYAHRLAWLWMRGEFPSDEIDHKNSDGLDNSWNNIREATRSQNGMNRRSGRLSKKISKGVFVPKTSATKPFVASITAHGKQRYLGHFKTEAEAAAAYAVAAQAHHGEFARVA